MSIKATKTGKTAAVRNLSRAALTAAKAFKGLSVSTTPAKLKGTKATAIKRAVRAYYLG